MANRTRNAWLVAVAVVAVVVIGVVLAVALGDDDEDDVDAGGATSTTVEATAPDTTAGGATTSRTAGPSTTTCEPSGTGEVLGRRDLDGDGVEELFVAAGSGAATDIIAVLRVEGCEATAVTNGGAPAEFPVGASARNISGLHATGDGLVAYAGTTEDDESFQVTWRTYRLDGDTLVEVASDQGTAQMGDDLYTTASTFGV